MAASTARAELETLLRSRKLDTTLTTALPAGLVPADRLAATGQAGLDRALGGGVPRGQISELVGRRSTGRTATATAMLADATARGELVAFIDTLDRFDPASAEAAGVRLDHLLWVRGDGSSDTQLALDAATWEPSRPGGRRQTPMRRAVGRALKALALVLSSGGFGVVVLDLADVPERLLAALPFTTWMRLQRMVAGSDTAVVLLADAPVTRSSGGASVRMAGRPRPLLEPAVSSSFRDRVLANRRPFVGTPAALDRSRVAGASAGLWAGDPVSRRFRGLAVDAHVQAGLRTSDCTLDLLR